MRKLTRLSALAGSIFAISASADSLVFSYDNTYTDIYTPAGKAPWLSATFTDIDKYTVSLEVKSLSLSGGEFVSFWGFNTATDLDPSKFTFKLISSVAYSGGNNVTTSGQDSVKAGGNVHLDFDLNLGNHNFGIGSDVMFYITSSTPISASDFNVTSDGTDTGYYSSAHIQGFSNGKSAWADPSGALITGSTAVAVPEASPIAAAAFSVTLVAVSAYRARRTQLR